MAHLQQWVSVLSECRHSGKCLYFIWLHPCGCEWIGPRSKPPTFLSFSAPLFPLPSPLPPPPSPSSLPPHPSLFWLCLFGLLIQLRFAGKNSSLIPHTTTQAHPPLSPSHLPSYSTNLIIIPSTFHCDPILRTLPPPTSPTFKFPTINTQVLVLHCTLLLYNSHLPSIYDPLQNPKYLQSEALWTRSQTINSIKPSFFLPGPTSTIFLLW